MTHAIEKDRSYRDLVSDLLTLLEESRIQAEQMVSALVVRTRWEMGKRLSLSPEVQSPGPNQAFFARLAGDLGLTSDEVYRSLQFFRAWPTGLPKKPDVLRLTWSVHKALLPAKDEGTRRRLAAIALEKGWTREDVRRALRGKNLELAGKESGETPTGKRRLARPEPGLHIYKAVVERVVDGDTLEVRIDLGFDVWKVDKIRLRGIDTPELKMAKGKEAKAHVEELMEGLPFVVLRTYQTDRYARYVADLFYHPTLTTKESVFEKGRFLNQELVEDGMAVLVT